MRLAVTEEQALLRQTARDLLSRRCAPERVMELRDRGAFDADLWRTAGSMGWPGTLVPEPAGLGLGCEEACALLAECGRVLAPLPLASSFLAGRLVADAGGPGSVLAEIARGSRVAVMAGEAAAIVRDAAAAEAVLCLAGDRLRLVRVADAGRVEPRLTAGRLREASVDLSGAGGVDCGRLADGPERLRTLRLLFEAAEMAGACERALEISAEHVRSRVQFERPLAAFQSVQHRLADMLTDLDGMRWLVARTASELDAGRTAAAAGLAVRLAIWTREASGRLVASALQVHGGVGFIRDHPLHLYFGRQKSCELSFGTLSELRELAAADLLGGPPRIPPPAGEGRAGAAEEPT